MRLVCASQEWVRKYQELCENRQLGYVPWFARQALLVADGRELVAGCMVYDTTGPFLFFEHLVTNETATLRQRWAAVDMMASEVAPMCRHVGKLPQVLVRHRGIARILKRYGLQETGAMSLTCTVRDLETNDYEKQSTSANFAGRGQDSAPTERAPAGDAEDGAGIYAEMLGGAAGSGC